MNVQIRAKRILSHLAAYQPAEISELDSDRANEQVRALGATPIGTYLNLDGHGRLLITDLGVFVDNGADSTFVEYKSVQRLDIVADGALVEQDVSKKNQANGLLIGTSGALSKLIPVRNGNGQCRDVFEFARFMRRVVDDVKGRAFKD